MHMDDQVVENEVFRALADPTRRALLSMLGDEAQPVSALTAHFAMSQPAISQHLKVLREVGLVSERKAGRQRIYALESEPLHRAAEWLERHTDFWATRLDNLGRHLREKHGKDA
jgi:DNA-binding transcriptional ArsR family regulator